MGWDNVIYATCLVFTQQMISFPKALFLVICWGFPFSFFFFKGETTFKIWTFSGLGWWVSQFPMFFSILLGLLLGSFQQFAYSIPKVGFSSRQSFDVLVFQEVFCFIRFFQLIQRVETLEVAFNGNYYSSPPLKTQQSFILFSHHVQLQKIFNHPKLQKSLHQNFMWSFPFPHFSTLSKTHPFCLGREWIQPTILGAERFPGVALCGLPRTSQLRHGVDEVQSSKGAAFKKTHGGFGGWTIFRDFFFFVRSFFLSHPRFRKWSVFVPGSCFWFIVFDWYLLIEFEYGSLFLMYGVWKLQTGLSMRFPLRGGYVFCNSFFCPPPSYSLNKKKRPFWC